jgi:hypothetical protein
MINNILGLLGNKFFTITFVKKDLSIRTINGRLKVTKYLKGGNCTLDKEKFLIVYSLKDKGYRAINKEAILAIKMDNMVIFNKGV